MPSGEDVSNGEIVRTLRSLQEEIRALRGEHVRRDLYEAHKAATDAELARIDQRCRADLDRLEREVDARERDRATMRRQMAYIAVAALLGLVANLVLFAIK